MSAALNGLAKAEVIERVVALLIADRAWRSVAEKEATAYLQKNERGRKADVLAYVREQYDKRGRWLQRPVAVVSSSFEFDLTSAAVGPRVKVWGDVDTEEVDAACPDGWEVDWNTSPSPLSSTRDGERGFAHPLCEAYGTPLPAENR